MQTATRQACKKFCYGRFNLNFKEHGDVNFHSLVQWIFVPKLNDELVRLKSALNLNPK